MTIPQLKAEMRSRRAGQRPHATPRTSPMPSAKARAGNGRRSIMTTTASVVSRFAALRRLGACLVLGLDVRAFCCGALRAWEAFAMRTTYTSRPSAQRRKDREVPPFPASGDQVTARARAVTLAYGSLDPVASDCVRVPLETRSGSIRNDRRAVDDANRLAQDRICPIHVFEPVRRRSSGKQVRGNFR